MIESKECLFITILLNTVDESYTYDDGIEDPDENGP